MRKLLMVGVLLIGGMAQAQTWQAIDNNAIVKKGAYDFFLLVETWEANLGGTLLNTGASTLFTTTSGGMSFCQDYIFLGLEGNTAFIQMTQYSVLHDSKDYPSQRVLEQLREGTNESIKSANFEGCAERERRDVVSYTLRVPKSATFNLLGNFKDLRYRLSVDENLRATLTRVN